MKKYTMNKDVIHNGKMYKKGSEIKDGMDGFKDIVNAGHAVEHVFGDDKPEEVSHEEKPEVKAKGKK